MLISFRLRDRDKDLKEKFDSLPEYIDKSDVIRAALRLYFKSKSAADNGTSPLHISTHTPGNHHKSDT